MNTSGRIQKGYLHRLNRLDFGYLSLIDSFYLNKNFKINHFTKSFYLGLEMF